VNDDAPTDASVLRAWALTYVVGPSDIPGQWQADCREAGICCTSIVGDDSPYGALAHTIFEVARALDRSDPVVLEALRRSHVEEAT